MTASDGARSVCRPPAGAARDLVAPHPRHAIFLGFVALLVLWTIGLLQALSLLPAAIPFIDPRRAPVVFCAAGLLLTVVVGLLVARHVRRDWRLRNRQAEQSARDLHRLSSRLVGAIEEVRRDVARELHDEIGQALTAIKMELAHAERVTRPEAAVALQGARNATDAALHAVRDLTHMLHPRMLDDLGLAAALQTQVREFSRRTGIAAELRQEAIDDRADAHVALCVYRVVQEALTNVGRHAAATRCEVSLSCASGVLRVSVADDGRGFDPRAAAPGGGAGLLGIQERVAGCGGRYWLDSEPGKGTRLVVDLPLGASAAASESGTQNAVAGAV